MFRLMSIASLAVLFTSGCGNQPTTEANRSLETGAITTAEIAPMPTAENSFALNSENTKIEFVGTHVGEKPDPRNCSFKEFSGSIGVDSGEISSITMEIDTSSLDTEFEKLTTHLKSPDFFDVRKFPEATFHSTSITSEGEGEVTVTGMLTLMGVTKEITFPATVHVSEGAVRLMSTFEIDRTEFGMDYVPDKVEKIVTMTVTVDA